MKMKVFILSNKCFVLILKFVYNRRFLYKETDILVGEFRRERWKLYKIVYKEKTAMCNNPIEFQF